MKGTRQRRSTPEFQWLNPISCHHAAIVVKLASFAFPLLPLVALPLFWLGTVLDGGCWSITCACILHNEAPCKDQKIHGHWENV